MGKAVKKILKYGNGQLPDNLSEILSNADENDLKILITLMMAEDEKGEVAESFSVADTLGLEESAVAASLKFWRGAGIIGAAKSTARAQKTEGVKAADMPSATEKPVVQTAHRDGAIERSMGLAPYNSDELASLFEKRKITAEFIDEAQRVFGKTFNSNDTGIVVGLIDQFDFDEAAVLAILSYVVRLDKRTMRYAERVALSFYDAGYTHTAEVVERIAFIERSRETISKIRQIFGFGGRELSKTEKSYFEKWTQKFEYEEDVVRLAYDITVDRTQKPLPRYTDAILSEWYAAGLRTVEAIEKYEDDKNGGGSAPSSVGKSYDFDDFFDAAVKRGFDDIK